MPWPRRPAPCDLLEDRLGGRVDEVLGLLEAEARERTDLLDDLDLLVAGAGEDDVELVLLFLGCGSVTTRGTTGGCCNCNRSRCGNAELLLERLHELRELEHRPIGDCIQNVVLRKRLLAIVPSSFSPVRLRGFGFLRLLSVAITVRKHRAKIPEQGTLNTLAVCCKGLFTIIAILASWVSSRFEPGQLLGLFGAMTCPAKNPTFT